MLPDLPKSRKALDGFWLDLVNRSRAAAGPLAASISNRIQREGDEAEFQTVQGQTRGVNYKKLSAEVSVRSDQGCGLTLEQYCKKAEEAGQAVAQQMSKMVVAGIEEAVKETGNEVVMRGGLTPDGFLDMLQKVEMDFDENGQPLGQFYAGSAMMQEIARKVPEWNADPHLRARHEDIIQKKREEFREREARRRLVD